jgi:hypothetical protein
MRLALLLAIAACSSDPDEHVSMESGALGLNDVSILLPLPPSTQAPVISTLGGLVPSDVFTRVVVMPGDVDVSGGIDEFHLVAIRFDLCDRPTPGACATGDDGRLRLVFQPVFLSGMPQANDVAVHAFYPIPNGELAGVVDELRALAKLSSTPTGAPLRLTAQSAAYNDALRALVMRYAGAAKLTRMTLFAQNAFTASLNWAFRGEELKGGAFAPIEIPTVSQVQQRTILVGGDTTYQTMPVADSPAGFALAIDSAAFGAASPAAQMQALEAMAEIQNPLKQTAETVQCLGCHVTTFLTARRAQVAGVDPTAVTGRYSSRFDLTMTGMSTANNRSLRAFGYLFAEPMISQRVINDSAQVLVEIEARFPPAMP